MFVYLSAIKDRGNFVDSWEEMEHGISFREVIKEYQVLGDAELDCPQKTQDRFFCLNLK